MFRHRLVAEPARVWCSYIESDHLGDSFLTEVAVALDFREILCQLAHR